MCSRIEKMRLDYVNTKPSICVERAVAFTKSHMETEGQPLIIRRAKAFQKVCAEIPVNIFEGEVIVGTPGKFKRSGFICPEFSWKWVEEEMDGFSEREQDPYLIGDEQKDILRREVFPYWKGKSLEETFLARLPRETAKIAVDTGIVDNDSKWRSAVGEITPDYQDIIFKKGFRGIIKEAKEHLDSLEPLSAESIEKIHFYKAAIKTSNAIINLARRYSASAVEAAKAEPDGQRKKELLDIAFACANVPENPPQSFHEAVQTVWFVQLGEILSENSLALNLGRFDQYMYPLYERDIRAGKITREKAQELINMLWLKLSEWVWAISKNTSQYFAGYNAFQNLTVGGRKRDGSDATNEISYMCIEATQMLKTHQPGLSVRIHRDCPKEFLVKVCSLISKGMGFPAVHNDDVGAKMLIEAGLSPEDAMDWSNCGCVVPHFRKIGEWTAAANINLAAALEYALNDGKSRITGEIMGVREDMSLLSRFEDVKQAYFRQLSNLIKHSVIATLVAQQIHGEIVPRPFLSLLVDGCIQSGKDLSRGGARYNVGPVLTGIGVADVANSLAAVRRLVFEKQAVSLEELNEALDANWQGHEQLRKAAVECPKYGNDIDYVDNMAAEIAEFYNREIKKYRDFFGSPFNSAFMGISNYVPTGKVVGALPDGRLSKTPLTEGVSPHAGTDVTSPTAAMRSASKIDHNVHSGGTLLNVKLSPDIVRDETGISNMAALIRGCFSLGAFHVQFNVISAETLRKAQSDPESHRDLLVRVAGYSTQFINLSREMQDAIIERTTYDTV
ncbi:formate C-acetyltransferase [Peptoclostridium litorale DSM 5388]|uniref:Formate acetyltransferase 2 n=1 Tax=Peptoclostridium litorale DSM 5388 TaxID=1121324 RepID=A0A069RFE1_PEPLI|nr:formate C-acetyltransferase/glycerol dehydratase family glycyl radical enzyme [Peptoclostridium litorale]KDR95508.1 formate acetyltransferase 2 [Peptoclostridium litorale DSM 5388]SIO17208.1 formate C-acetyltransferase [Peptoclostridium litorale DSM 5388]